MRQFFRRLRDKYLDRELGLQVQLFNVLAIAGILVSIFSAVVSLGLGESYTHALIYLLFALLAFALLEFARRSRRYQLCYSITIVAIFLLGFPYFYFINNGFHGAMPYFFIFAVVFTVFMLEGFHAFLFAALELLVYSFICIFSYFRLFPEGYAIPAVTAMADCVFGFVTVSIALSICMSLHFQLFRKQQEALAERNDILDRINRQKTEFLSNISHELKTPLTVVSSHVQLGRQDLQDNPQMADMENTLKLIGGEVERMALMVTQILDVSRIDEGRMVMELRQESAVEIVQFAMDTYYPVFSKNRNTLVLRKEGDIPPVLCDRTRIIQVLVNLISNATRHTRGGEITVSLREEAGGALITVSDTGEGIEPERMPHLFERYHSRHKIRQGETPTALETGTGLGLYICKYIVEAQGGRIWLESQPGEGTRAHFILPGGLSQGLTSG